MPKFETIDPARRRTLTDNIVPRRLKDATEALLELEEDYDCVAPTARVARLTNRKRICRLAAARTKPNPSDSSPIQPTWQSFGEAACGRWC